MHYVYILYSKSIDKYYVGETSSIEERLEQHNSGYFAKSYTSKVDDWQLVLSLPFPSITKARQAEQFIKRMKSRKFIERLLIDSAWLIEKYK
jgi:putative endonuclease